MNKNVIAPVILAGALAVSVAACGPHHVSAAESASASAQAHALATSSAAAEGKAIMKQCAPKSPLAQFTWFRGMLSKKGDGPATRQAFASCAGIPPAKSKAFENDALKAAENAAESAAKSKTITLRQAGTVYLEVTLPALVVKYRQS